VKARYGWALLLTFIVVWDVAAAMTNGESLTFGFRRAVTDSALRWPLLVVVVLLVVHLFLPPKLRSHDPLDRLYERVAALRDDHPSTPPAPTAPAPPEPFVHPRR
jgi:uncharacterized membrane protein YhdT